MGKGARKREKIVPLEIEDEYVVGYVPATIPLTREPKTMTLTEYKAAKAKHKDDAWALSVIQQQIKAGELRITND